MSDDNNKRESYYYSYGPFKSQPSDHEHDHEYMQQNTSDQSQHSGRTVEVTPSRVTYAYEPAISDRKPKSNRAIIFSFILGIVLAGSLMFVANWFDLFGFQQASSADLPEISDNQFYKNYFDQPNNGVSNVSNPMSLPDIADIAERSSPAVVKIETMVKSGSSNPRFNDDFFRDFFGDFYQSPPSQESRPGGVGSGFIFEKNGYILTNQHVLANAEEIWVTVLGHKEPFKAILLGTDYDLDLAVIKIEGNDFPTLPFGNSANLRVGDWVTAIGNPVGFDHTVSVGVISANEREISIPDRQGTRTYHHLLQTDASINPGNSGGPLLNLNGEVVGINTAVSVQAQGIGFAIPTSTIVSVLDHLKNNEVIPKPFIGVEIKDIDELWQKNLGLDSTEGSLIIRIEKDSPASRAGLRAGDVIIKIDDENIADTNELIQIIQQKEVGERISAEIIRDGKNYEVVIIVGDRNEQQ